MADRIVFTAPYLPTFVRYDLEVLKENYQVYEDVLAWKVKWAYPFLFIFQFFRLLYHIPISKAVFCSFGGYWCLLPTLFGKLFRKPVFIVLNGTDCCAAPKINYGVLRKWLPKRFCHASYKLADRLLPISESLLESLDDYSEQVVGEQGIKTHFPKLKTPATMIPYGFDTDFWKYDEHEERTNQFVTVVHAMQFARRDIGLLFELFEKNSDWKLTLIGSLPKRTQIPQNVSVKPWMSQTQLRDEFKKSNYYIQLSLYEGFGCAMAEAMACGCIPIGTAVNAIPEIVGHTGLIFQRRGFSAMQNELRDFLENETTDSRRQKVRSRIVSNYPLVRRKEMLYELIEQND